MKIKMGYCVFYCVAAVPELLIMGRQLCWALCTSWGRRDEGALLAVRDRSFGDRAFLGVA